MIHGKTIWTISGSISKLIDKNLNGEKTWAIKGKICVPVSHGI